MAVKDNAVLEFDTPPKQTVSKCQFFVIFGLDPDIQKNIIGRRWIPDYRFRE
jgi:hypothetical protein